MMIGWLLAFVAALSLAGAATAEPAPVGRTVEIGRTGFALKRPVLASACPDACPWGELGDFVKAAMAPMGYEVILCRNCNRTEGPRLVAKIAPPPPLVGQDLLVGTDTRFDNPPDFGITASGFLAAGYQGKGPYAKDGPFRNLRLIARIEDPTYLLVAVRKESGITDLGQIKERRLPVKILVAGDSATALLEYYGLTPQVLASFGASEGLAMGANNATGFDVIVSDLASPANNPESSFWTSLTQKNDLKFLDIPEPFLARMAAEPGYERVTAKWGLLRGVDRIIPTIGRSGEAVFARDDTPEQAAYDIAKAIDQRRGELKWFVRPYSYDPRTVGSNLGVPLHPGAARYYREAGYLKPAPRPASARRPATRG
jgi:TRAP-type uncharacterized transport system substrate-binding protein